MDKEEIIEIIKEKTENFMFQTEIDLYVEGFLDALIKAREITWDERYEIEDALKDE